MKYLHDVSYKAQTKCDVNNVNFVEYWTVRHLNQKQLYIDSASH